MSKVSPTTTREHLYMFLGYILFVGMMAIGYAYNVTFVQIGLVDLGTRLLNLSRTQIALNMALMAIITCIVSIAIGFLMFKLPRLQQFVSKLRLTWFSIMLQTVLTALVLTVHTEGQFRLWIVFTSLALGVAVPATFSMTVDLILVKHRGMVAAAITGLAYFISAYLLTNWNIEIFTLQFVLIMLPGCIALAILAFVPQSLTQFWSQQQHLRRFAVGRLVKQSHPNTSFVQPRILIFLFLMFGIYFIDSLGFLRILETPLYLNTAWQAADADVRLFIAGTHVIAAIVAGILYQALHERQLFLWIFGIFALVHLMYTMHSLQGIGENVPLTLPMFYAIAVSLYTVVNFALWADLSTPKTIGLYSALGVAFSGWSATFISTGLALVWQQNGMPFDQHVRIVDSIALIFFIGMLLMIYLQGDRRNEVP